MATPPATRTAGVSHPCSTPIRKRKDTPTRSRTTPALATHHVADGSPSGNSPKRCPLTRAFPPLCRTGLRVASANGEEAGSLCVGRSRVGAAGSPGVSTRASFCVSALAHACVCTCTCAWVRTCSRSSSTSFSNRCTRSSRGVAPGPPPCSASPFPATISPPSELYLHCKSIVAHAGVASL